MTSYFFHVKFELYPTGPAAAAASGTTAQGEADGAGPVWVPSEGASIFDELPAHALREEASRALPLDNGTGTGTGTGGHGSLREGSSSSSSSGDPRRQRNAIDDWRFGRVNIRTVDPPLLQEFDSPINNSNNSNSNSSNNSNSNSNSNSNNNNINTNSSMAGETSKSGSAAAPALGPTFEGAATATRAKYIRKKNTEAGWGVVRFYREGEETAGLNAVGGGGGGDGGDDSGPGPDCTTLCIPAVPAYMSPGDFLGYIGERWHGEISHCRMVMTSQLNRSLVLLKFRRSKEAKAFRAEYDGKVFNSVEPQACHVVFVRKITFETPTPTSAHDASSKASKSGAMYNSLKPMPPPTPNLVELPTCPVCLERMDETNGLMTIPCSHIFHCTCLQNWKGAGCPVCRFTNPSEGSDPSNPLNQPFGGPASNLCHVCDCADDLWICLICGLVGCGRYKGGHAKDHWKETAHCFALELETQHVWDYAGDMWVHRLIRDKGDGKVVELPGRGNHGLSGSAAAEDEEMVPRAKLDAISLEFSHLIVSQLESQRAYYEELVNKAVDKASKAAGMAEQAIAQLTTTAEKFEGIERRVRTLNQDTIPQLERDLERERGKAKKGENLSRSLGQALQVEKRLNEGLMGRIAHLDKDAAAVQKQLEELRRENAELKESNRDLTVFISGQEKLRELESEGKLEGGDVEGATVSVPVKKSNNRRRKR